MTAKRGQLDELLDVGRLLAPDFDDELHAGSRLGRYTIVRRLGVGAMGVVWRAHDADLDRDIALKVLRTTSESARARLLREARVLAKLRHPNVITVYDAARIDERDVIALELIDGETLAGWLLHRHSRHQVVATLVAAGRGLAAAHEAGIVHRDFKPHNVLVERGGRVVVTDFGLACAVGEFDDGEVPGGGFAVERSLTATGAVLGTPAYMAPEQLAGEPIDERADQFAFCATMWEALVGARPFAGDSMEAIAAAIATGGPSGADRLPRRLRAPITRGLAHEPEHRWPSMGKLLDTIVRAERRGKRIVLAAAAIALCACVALVIRHELPSPPPAKWRPQITDLLAFEENSDGPVFSPDGTRIAYVSDREQTDAFRAYVAPLTGGDARPVTPPGENVMSPRWTRDGRALLLVRWVGDRYAIARQPIDGGRLEDLGEGAGVDDCGDALAIAELGPHGSRLVLRRPDGTRDPVLTSREGTFSPRCDATGQYIVFGRGPAPIHDPVDDLVITDRAGHELQLTHGRATSGGVFTPDGRWIVFSALADGQVYLYEIPVTGGVSRRLTSENGPHLNPDVSPDGGTLAFDRDVGGTVVIAGAGDSHRKLTARREILLSLALTRDGALLLAGRLNEKGNELVVISTRDGSERTLAFGLAGFLSTDDRRVLFGAVDGEPRLQSIPLEGGAITTLAKLPGQLVEGADGPDGAHLQIHRGDTTEAWRLTPDGALEPEGSVGLVIPAPRGDRRVVRTFDRLVRLRFGAPGGPEHEVVGESWRPTWLDDRRLAYVAGGKIRVVDAVTGTELMSSPGPDWGERVAIAIDGVHWYSLSLVGHVTRHLLVNFGDRPGR